jgi:hypothetical protein
MDTIWPSLRTRITLLHPAVIFPYVAYLYAPPEPITVLDNLPFPATESAQWLAVLVYLLDRSSGEWPQIEQRVRAIAEEHSVKPGELFMLLRIALTGTKISLPLADIFKTLGKSETICRLIRSWNLCIT